MMRFFYTAILTLLFCFPGVLVNALENSYIVDYKRSKLDKYQIVSKDASGNKWQIENDWKTRRSDTGRVVSHEYEKVLFEKREEGGKLQYNIHFELYERDQEIETRLHTSYVIEGRPDHYEVDLIGFETYSIAICGMKSAIIMLRAELKQQAGSAGEGSNRGYHRYYYDHIFINLEKDGEAVFYPDPLDSSLIDGPILAYFSNWSEKEEYNCTSGFLTFQ